MLYHSFNRAFIYICIALIPFLFIYIYIFIFKMVLFQYIQNTYVQRFSYLQQSSKNFTLKKMDGDAAQFEAIWSECSVSEATKSCCKAFNNLLLSYSIQLLLVVWHHKMFLCMRQQRISGPMLQHSTLGEIQCSGDDGGSLEPVKRFQKYFSINTLKKINAHHHILYFFFYLWLMTWPKIADWCIHGECWNLFVFVVCFFLGFFSCQGKTFPSSNISWTISCTQTYQYNLKTIIDNYCLKCSQQEWTTPIDLYEPILGNEC